MTARQVLIIFAIISTNLIQMCVGVRCKCTMDYEAIECIDDICEIETGSCLMLDHPSRGVHYTCHRRGLKDGTCHNRTSKSGASVRICGCNSTDFCNYSLWPDKNLEETDLEKHTNHHKHHHHHHHQHHKQHEQPQVAESQAMSEQQSTVENASPIQSISSIILIISTLRVFQIIY